MLQNRVCSLTLAAALMVGLTVTSVAQPAAPKPDPGQVVKLLQSGLGEDVLLEKIKKDGVAYDLSTDDLIALKAAGASGAVLKAMLNPGAAGGSAAAAVAPGQVQNPDLPDELGVYIRIRGQWVSIEPEVLNLRTANMLGHAFSYGIAKGKMKGDVAGVKAKVQIAKPVELLIRCAEGTSASEYQVLRLEQKQDRREIETAEIGFAGAKTGARKGLIDVKFEKVGKATYKTVINALATGEYGVLPPAAATSAGAGSAGRLFAFGIIE